MTFLLLSMVLVAVTFSVVRPAMATEPRIPVIGINAQNLAILVGLLLVIALTAGPVASLSLASAVLLNEAGHVFAHRLAGHQTVRFRLFPATTRDRVSEEPHDSDLSAFFTTLMGPAVSIAPMALAFALSDLCAGSPLEKAFGTLALTLGAFNFVALLPLWPLPGGTLLKLITHDRIARLHSLPAAAIVVALIALAFLLDAPLLILAGVLGGFSFSVQPDLPKNRAQMSPREARLALAAYIFTFAASFLGGWWVLLLAAGRF